MLLVFPSIGLTFIELRLGVNYMIFPKVKGTVTQNIFYFKSGLKGCKDLGKDDDLIRKKETTIKFYDVFWPLKLCLHDFAEQCLHCSIILRGEERCLHDFAGQRTKTL